jgi:chromatin remodeling complex protein RSC6
VEDFRKDYVHRITEELGPWARKQDRRGHHSKEVQLRMQAQGRGFFAPVTLSDELADICGGAKRLPRTEVTKLVWKYIKFQNLQNDRDRRIVQLDDKLRAVCGDLGTVNCFKLSKYISQHMSR